MRRLRLAVLLLVALAALLVFPLGSSGLPSAGNTWAGTWNSDFGKLTLSAGGSGNYEGFNPGSVSGTVNGNVLQGTWMQPGNPPKQGTFKFTMSADGRSFSGVWAYDSGGCGTACGWNGTCVAGPCLRNGAATKPKPKPRGCPVPPRLPASVRAETCSYSVRFLFEQHRPAVQGNLSEITTIGTGGFFVNLPAQGTHGCGESHGRTVIVEHLHEQITQDDLHVHFDHDPGEDSCLDVKRRGKKVIALVATVKVRVLRSTDTACPKNTPGEIVFRAGEPFPYIAIDVCNHHEIYSPPKSKDKKRTVKVAIVVKPG